MARGLKLAQKGIILISVPILFELIFLGGLAYLLGRAEQAIHRASLSQQIMFEATEIQRRASDAVSSAAIYKFTKNKLFKDRCVNAIAASEESFERLSELVGTKHPDQQAKLALARKTYADAGETIRQLLKRLERDPMIKSVFSRANGASLRKEREILQNLSTTLTDFIEGEQEVAKDFEKNERVARQNVVIALIFGGVANVVMGIGLSLFFFRGIATRVHLLIENTKRIPKKIPLNPPIGGSDEIAELDTVFHQTVRELEETEQMKQYLIGMVSHDLRSPLTAVQGALELLSAGAMGELPERATAKIRGAEADVKRLIRLTNDLLDVEKLTSGKIGLEKETIAASDMLDESREFMRSFAEQHQVTIETTGDDFIVEADPERLMQVLCNLVGNAVKFSPKGSVIVLRTAIENGSGRFEVIDKGPGIAAEHQATVFDKFTQVSGADNSRLSGKGLGLAICKSLTELHNGQIGVTSNLGEGSTFWLTVPGAHAVADDPDQSVAGETEIAKSTAGP